MGFDETEAEAEVFMGRSGAAMAKGESAQKSYRDDVQRIRWFTGHLRRKILGQIDRSLVDGLIAKHLQASDRTKDLYVALIRAIFRRAMREWEWLDNVPALKT